MLYDSVRPHESKNPQILKKIMRLFFIAEIQNDRHTVCREVVKIKFDFRLWILNFMFYICHKRSAPSYRKEKSQKSLLLFEIFQGLYTQKINEKKLLALKNKVFVPSKKNL